MGELLGRRRHRRRSNLQIQVDILARELHFQVFRKNLNLGIWTFIPPIYTEARSASTEHSGLAWGQTNQNSNGIYFQE